MFPGWETPRPLKRGNHSSDVRVTTPMIKRAAATVGVCLSVLGACDGGTNPERTGASIVVVSGGGVTDTIAVALPAPLVVEVRGPDGNVAPGVEVLFISGPDSTAVPLVFIRRSSLTEYAAVAHGTTDGSGRTSVRLFTDYTAGRTEITVRAPTLAVETSASVTVQPGGPARVTVRPRDSREIPRRRHDVHDAQRRGRQRRPGPRGRPCDLDRSAQPEPHHERQ